MPVYVYKFDIQRIQAVVSCLAWDLGTKFWSSVRAVTTQQLSYLSSSFLTFFIMKHCGFLCLLHYIRRVLFCQVTYLWSLNVVCWYWGNATG